MHRGDAPPRWHLRLAAPQPGGRGPRACFCVFLGPPGSERFGRPEEKDFSRGWRMGILLSGREETGEHIL